MADEGNNNTGMQTLRILLVEDNPAHVKLIIRAFAKHPMKCKIYLTGDGAEALDFLAQKNPLPHLVLLDLRLPKIDGLKVLAEIKSSSEFSKIPVVILTTSDAAQDLSRAYELHVNGYLLKPVKFEQLSQLLQDLDFYLQERR
ncbi:response regulator [Candidatus Riflebacteria bacterium]